jgi:hypothetical protein
MPHHYFHVRRGEIHFAPSILSPLLAGLKATQQTSANWPRLHDHPHFRPVPEPADRARASVGFYGQAFGR